MFITVTPCPIAGLYAIQPQVFGDKRGYFFESYSERDFRAVGLTMAFVQDNQFRSVKGTLRGLHDQRYAIDCSRIQEELGWRSGLSFEEGLERTVDW